MRPLIVSYATRHPAFYVIAREEMIRRCGELGLRYSIRLIDPSGDWYACCRHKPYFLRQCLRGEVWLGDGASKHQPLVWVDVDCRIDRADSLPQDFDVGQYQSQGSLGWTVGLIALNRTEGARRFVDAWIARMEDEGAPGDHGPFVRTCDKPPEGVRVIEVTDYFDLAMNEFTVPIRRRPGPLACPVCGRTYDEALQGRLLTCWQCGKVFMA